jgi:type II secretory pathway pseudopilin PulG
MNLLVKKKQMDNLVLDEESAAEAILDESSKGPTPLLKFKKDKYVIGKDTTVPLGTRFIAYCADWRRGWVKFFGEEKVDEKVYRVAENRTVLERDELGDLDQSDWETDEDGKAQDPWCFQHYVPLENAKTGERFLFVTSSTGGQIGVEVLCHQWSKNNTKGLRKGLPTIELALGEFHTRKFGAVKRPHFAIIGWENDDNNVVSIKDITPKAPAEALPPRMKEEKEGPPEYDPDDPGYEPVR